MDTLRSLAIFVQGLCWCALAQATPAPTDVVVQFSATPNTDLHPGDVISFTLSVTNLGPEPVAPFAVASSEIYDELDLFDGGTTNCDDHLVLAVLDYEDHFTYELVWFPLGAGDLNARLQAGETLTCDFTRPYTQWAPPEFPLTFTSDLEDLDDSNNSATVVLRGPTAFALTAVPATSPLALTLLALLLAVAAGLGLSSCRRGRRQRGR